MKKQKLSFGQKVGNLLGRSKSPGSTQTSALNTKKSIQVRGQLFALSTEKVDFSVKHKAQVVDIRDADFNESQKLLTETLEEYF